jgi:YVTN family beta-propeller protein
MNHRLRLASLVAFFTCFVFPFALAIPSAAQGTAKQSLLALSKRDHTLAIVDPQTLQVIGRAPVGPDPHEVIASEDGKTAYVSIYGGGAYHVISVIDLVSQKALPDIDLGALNGPHGLDFVGGRLWFTAEGAKAIGHYDPETRKIDWIMGTGQRRTHMIHVTHAANPDQRQIFTTNVNAATVSLWQLVKPEQFRPPMPPPGESANGSGGPRPGMGGPGGPPHEPQLEWVQTVVPVGKGDEGFDVTPDGRELWTANAQDGTISIVNIADKKVVATLDANINSANRLKFTPDGKYALISLLGGSDLVIYDVASRKEFKRVKLGHGAAGILMDPSGTRAFIGCTADNYVAVVDLKTWQVTSHIDVGGEPDGLAWAVQQ